MIICILILKAGLNQKYHSPGHIILIIEYLLMRCYFSQINIQISK